MSEHSSVPLTQCSSTSSEHSVISISCHAIASTLDLATETEATGQPSLVDVLRSPSASELSRKRKVASNPPSGKKKAKGSVASEPIKVDVRDRLKQFPQEPFTIASGNNLLFCKACRETISLKKSVIVSHIKSTKHSAGLERLKLKQAREQDIVDMLKAYDQEVHPVGESLSDDVRVYRVKVVESFLKAGVPLSKIDCFRELLEENFLRLSSSTHLCQLIPVVQREEERKLLDDINDNDISVIFDGTTHVCEAMVIVLRFVNKDWCIQQKVARLLLVAKSMTGEELARELVLNLSTELRIPNNHLLACMHDRASVNKVAIQTLKIMYPSVVDIGCFSHTLDHVGEKFNTPILDQFAKSWINLFSRSPKAKLAWREKTGLPIPTYSATRWWSKWEVLKALLLSFGDVESFLTDCDLPPSRLKLLEILEDLPKCRKLRIELAVTVDAGEPFVKATYLLEGDGPLALSAYKVIQQLHVSVRNEHYPNVVAVARRLSTSTTQSDQLVRYAKLCIKPGYDYFKQKFDEDLSIVVEMFKHMRLFDPSFVADARPECEAIEELRLLPFLNSDLVIGDLKCELPTYIAEAEDVSSQVDKTDWWKKKVDKLPKWASACKRVLLLQPSSGAAERVFSLLSNSFSNRREHSLRDYIQTSVMLQYNLRSF